MLQIQHSATADEQRRELYFNKLLNCHLLLWCCATFRLREPLFLRLSDLSSLLESLSRFDNKSRAWQAESEVSWEYLRIKTLSNAIHPINAWVSITAS